MAFSSGEIVFFFLGIFSSELNTSSTFISGSGAGGGAGAGAGGEKLPRTGGVASRLRPFMKPRPVDGSVGGKPKDWPKEGPLS